MKAKQFVVRIALLSLMLTATFLFAQAPGLLNYQGKLTESGSPVNGSRSMIFAIYDAPTGGTPLWTETQSNVQVTTGVFSVLLGSVTAFPATVFNGSGDRYLEITVGSTIIGRFRFTSAAFAIRANQADGVADNAITSAKILNGAITGADVANGEVVRSVNNIKDNVTITAGSNITITPGANSLTIAATGVGTGDITAVNAGTGLSGGGPSGDVTVALNTTFTDGQYVNENQTNSVSNGMIQNGAVSGSKIALGTITSTNIADNAIGSAELQDVVAFGSASVNGFVQTYSSISRRIVASVANNTAGGGFMEVTKSDGNTAVSLSTRSNGTAGDISVYNSAGTEVAGINGDTGLIFGTTKSFIVADPRRTDRMIRYTSIEGPEAAIYVRGKANLTAGRVWVNFPEHFADMAVASSITVTLTPRSVDSKGLAIVEVTEKGMQVGELANGIGTYSFDFVVYAVRKGYENYPVYLDAAEFQGTDAAAPKNEQ